MIEKICCFTGHRFIPAFYRETVQAKLKTAVETKIKEGYTYFMTGGAIGFDTMAAETVLALREKYPFINLVLILPCRDQSKKWAESQQEEYERIKAKADYIIYMAYEYSQKCMLERNRYMVDNSASCICYLTSNKGGTWYTVNYAKNNSRDIFSL